MKHFLLAGALLFSLTQCTNNNPSENEKAKSDSATTSPAVDTIKDTLKTNLSDTIPDGKSSSSSDFSKGSSSPAGSTGFDSTLAKKDSTGIKKVKDKKAAKDSAH